MESKESILVVSGNQEKLSTMVSEFTAAGYKVETFDNGVDGWNLLLRTQPKAVFWDLFAPKLNAVYMLENVKKYNKPHMSNLKYYVVSDLEMSAFEHQEIGELGGVVLSSKAGFVPGSFANVLKS